MKPILDSIDNQIIALLMDDARLAVTTIAKKVGVARTTVISRIAALEKQEIIAGYGVKLNQALYQPMVRAYVGVSIDARYAGKFVQKMEAIPEVESLCAVSGVLDYMITLRCASTEILDKLLDKVGTLEGVRQTSTSIILSRKIDRRSM